MAGTQDVTETKAEYFGLDAEASSVLRSTCEICDKVRQHHVDEVLRGKHQALVRLGCDVCGHEVRLYYIVGQIPPEILVAEEVPSDRKIVS